MGDVVSLAGSPADLRLPQPGLLIGDERRVTSDRLEIVDPDTTEVFAEVSAAVADDVDDAISAARAAQPGWARQSPTDRGAILWRWSQLVERDAEWLATLEARDVGKPLADARRNVGIVLDRLRYFAGAADKSTGVTLPSADSDHVGYTLLEPRGVCAMIMAWNVPTLFAAGSVAPAIAAGNAVVYKPSEVAPLAPLALFELAVEAGVPPGVVNVLLGGPEVGQTLAGNPGIDHLSFVGSTATGADVIARSARNIVPVKIELGGKSPSVVLDDADLVTTAATVGRAVIDNAGQNCNAMSRVIAHRGIAADLVDAMRDELATVSIGAWHEAVEMGPLVSARQRDRVLGFIESGRHAGARLVTGGSSPPDSRPVGYYVSPTMFDRVTPQMAIAREEIFGPVLAVQVVDDDDDAVAAANCTPFGLAASIWTSDLSRAHRLIARLDAGQVSVNELGNWAIIGLPFETRKHSGFHKAVGYEAMLEYQRTKAVTINFRG
jgi:aldehyde dehydrogenase (NAD+)